MAGRRQVMTSTTDGVAPARGARNHYTQLRISFLFWSLGCGRRQGIDVVCCGCGVRSADRRIWERSLPDSGPRFARRVGRPIAALVWLSAAGCRPWSSMLILPSEPAIATGSLRWVMEPFGICWFGITALGVFPTRMVLRHVSPKEWTV